MNTNYAARVIRPTYSAHPDPEVNRIKIASWAGLTFIVGIDTFDELMVLLPAGCQVGEQLAEHNGMVRVKNEDGSYSGYLEQNRRVKAIRLRGVKSEGVLVSLSDLAFLGDVTVLNEGDVFEEFNGVKIAERWVRPFKAIQGTPKSSSRFTVENFVEHVDTENFRYNYKSLCAGDLVTVTLKQHGSCVVDTTPVLMGDGSFKLIKDVVIGDVVQSRFSKSEVTDVFSKIDDTKQWLKIVFRYRPGEYHEIICTSDHLIASSVDNEPAWVEAGLLIVGQYVTVRSLDFMNFTSEVAAIHKLDEQFECWDITTTSGNFVANNLVVHNSHRTAHLPVTKTVQLPRTWRDRLNRRTRTEDITSYELLTGSRRVVIDPASSENGWYGTNQFRLDVTNQFRLDVTKSISGAVAKNEIWFGEIVGWLPDSSTPIMSTVSTKALKDKDFTKRFGDKMTYKYGCPVGVTDFYVYRIAVQNPDGVLTDLSWSQVKARCVQAGIKHVPEVEVPIWGASQMVLQPNLTEDAIDRLLFSLEEVCEGVDPIDSSHIREGVVIRVDSVNGRTKFFKLKSHTFLTLEHGVADDVVDLEDVS